MSTEEILSLADSYDTISDLCSVNKIKFTFNDSYILKIQAKYSRILLIRCHLCEYDVRASSMRIFKAEFFKNSFNQAVSQTKMDTIVRTNTMLEKSCVTPIVFVDTTYRTILNIAFIVQLVDPISFHKRRFKAKTFFLIT